MHAFRYHGFTLIELIVVAVFVLILAAILYPVFAPRHHHGEARQTVCLNNQRQIGVAITMYVQDNNAVFFPDTVSNAWPVQLTAYGLDNKVFDCRSKSGTGSQTHPEYGFNPALFGRKLGNIASPATTLVTADLSMTNPPSNYTLHDISRDLDLRHNGGVILSCVDTHVVWESGPKQSETALAALLRSGYDVIPIGAPILKGPYTSSETQGVGYGRSSYVTLPASLFTPTSPNFAIQWDITYTGANEPFPAAGMYCSLFDAGTAAVTGSGNQLPAGGITVGFPSAAKLGLWVGGQLVAGAATSTNISTTTTRNIVKTGNLTNTILVMNEHIVWYVKDKGLVLGVVEYTYPTGSMPAFRTIGKKIAVYVHCMQSGTTATMENIRVTTF